MLSHVHDNVLVQNMLSPYINIDTPPKLCFSITIFVSLLLIVSHGYTTLYKADNDTFSTVSVGAIINTESRIGKEMKTAMKISVENFSQKSKKLKLRLYFRMSSSDPLEATFTGSLFLLLTILVHVCT